MQLNLGTVRRRLRRALPRRKADDVARRRRIADLVRASGLFDTEWYVQQLDAPLPAGVDPIDHYVATSGSTDISPNPAFLSEWYRTSPSTPRELDVAPFVHYVLRGISRNLPPHPLFDPEYYLAQHPEAADHRGGPLGHYLELGWRTGAGPHPDFDLDIYREVHGTTGVAPLTHFSRHTHEVLSASRGWEHLRRTSETFDHAAAERFTAETLAEYDRRSEDPPLVSIVIPTKDRRDGVLTAIGSVVAQSYPNWQLIVVDDGSTDGTAEAIEPLLADGRIELVRREHSGGVSRARNEGLARARGEYVAYLDSDNTWVTEFLAVMVAFVRTRSLRAAYAVSELVENVADGQRGYRALPFHREALWERNYIDCIVVLHERALLDEVGTFDEELRRNVDWDLLIRMSKVTDFALAPFIATRYDAWEERTDRITINEPMGYRFAVLGKHLVDWSAAEGGVGRRQPGTVSVVIHVRDAVAPVVETVERLFDHTDHAGLEVVLVDAKTSDAEFLRLQALTVRFPNVRVLRQTRMLPTELSRTIGAAHAHGETIVFLPARSRVEPGWLEPLRAALSDGAAAAQPLIMLPNGTTWSAGTAFARDARPHNLFRFFPADAPEVVRPATPTGLSAAALAVRAADFVAVRGFDPLFVNDFDNPDLSLRLARHTQLPLQYVPGSVVVLRSTPQRGVGETATANATDSQELLSSRWHDEVRKDDTEAWRSAGYTIVGYDGGASTHWGYDPIVVRDRPDRPLRWALKIGAPDVANRTNWGDWHFAIGLKDALERLGQEVVIDSARAWYRPTSRFDDVALVLRGVSVYRVNPQQLNLCWVISHPERVTRRELAGYDGVFAASTHLAERLSVDLGTPVRRLLQCTDARRFRPSLTAAGDREPEVLFVGNARGMRASVGAALEAGIVPSVYGVRWDGLLPDGAWRGEYVPNDELPQLYANAGVVLNDHWDDMRTEGLISNRLFDLTACGARVVSDDVAGLDELFGDSVLTFTTPEELAAGVATHLAETPERAAARMALSEHVRREHSFDARATELVDVARRLVAERGLATSSRPSRR